MQMILCVGGCKRGSNYSCSDQNVVHGFIWLCWLYALVRWF